MAQAQKRDERPGHQRERERQREGERDREEREQLVNDEQRRRTFKKDRGAASPHSTFLSMHLPTGNRVLV